MNSKINLGNPMTLTGAAALAYAKECGTWAGNVGIYANEIDQDGIFPASMDQVMDAAGEDVSLVFVEISAEEWARTCDTVADIISLESVSLEWTDNDTNDMDYMELIPGYMAAFYNELVDLATDTAEASIDGGEGGSREFKAICLEHAMAQAKAWVQTKCEWKTAGKVLLAVSFRRETVQKEVWVLASCPSIFA
jgi:hypothetical protein